MDVSVGRSVQSLIADIRVKFNTSPSIVVNSAGITRDNFLLKMDENSWNAVMNVNLKVQIVVIIYYRFRQIHGTIMLNIEFLKNLFFHLGYISCHTSCSSCNGR